MNIDPHLALDIWARLGEEGKAPSELTNAAKVLPLYTVAIDPWIERLVKAYIQDLAQRNAHFKLVIAPYGGGKTHFLMALGSRALSEGFAVSYIACSEGVSLEYPMDVYKAFMKNLQIPGEEKPGTRSLLQSVINHKHEQIKILEVPDPEAALGMWLYELSQEEYAELAFGRVMGEALRAQLAPEQAIAGDAALRWLRGEIDTLTKEELQSLKLAKVTQRDQKELGRNLLLSIIPFLREAGAKGVVILFDESETLFNAKGKALQRVLAAMRVVLDQPGGVKGGVPLFGLFAAVPDIIDLLSKYPAVEQRLAVGGAPFEEGNDFAPQLHLEKVASQQKLLEALGFKLLDLGENSRAFRFNRDLQRPNIDTLAKVASQSSLEIDARRLFVKACVNILDLQLHQGERRFSDDELRSRYRGFFDNLRQREEQEPEQGKGIIAGYHGRGADELVHRGLKDFGFEELPFLRFAPNAALYYTMLVAFFLFECFKRDISGDVIPVEAYATTMRRRLLDVAAKIVRHAGKIILKVAAAAMEQLQFAALWVKSGAPPRFAWA